MSIKVPKQGEQIADQVYRDPQGNLWRMSHYCLEPTVMMERLAPAGEDHPRDKVGGTFDCLNFKGWRRLVEEPNI